MSATFSGSQVSRDTATNATQLEEVHAALHQQIGYEAIRGDASASWLRLGRVVLTLAALAALLINRRLPG
jgi:Ca-activated chloride channel family protein